MNFTGVWRSYQARVLAEMDVHLADARLHIVAAPGSGKTVLGLEAMRRIGRRALVLSPSITIRDQWRERGGGVIDADEIRAAQLEFYRERPALLAHGLQRHAERIANLGLLA